jgi:hypothetical protein
MATRQDIEQAVLDQLASTLSTVLDIDVEAAYRHVALEERSEAVELPAYTFELFSSLRNRGITGGPLTASATANADTGDFEVLYANEHEVTLDVSAQAPRDSALRANDLFSALESDLTLYGTPSRDVEDLHPDMRRGTFVVDGVQNNNVSDQMLRAKRLRAEFSYLAFIAVDEDLIEEVTVDLGEETTDEQLDEFTITL